MVNIEKKYNIKKRFFHSNRYGYAPYPHQPSHSGRHHPGRPPREPFPHYPLGGSLPFTIEDFKDIKLYIVFILLEQNPNGITGYEIQEKYKFPRGSLVRLLEYLESNEYVKTEESVDKGRNKKLYLITEKGYTFFDNLKQRWAYQFSMMSEFAPPERFGNPLINPHAQSHIFQMLDESEDKEDILDYFRGMRSRLKGRLTHLKNRLGDIENIKSELDNLIEKINEMEKLNVEEIKKFLNQIQEKFHNREPVM